MASFEERAVGSHGPKYDYSKSIYVNNSTKLIIGCSIHGDFEQLPLLHIRGKGCPTCGRIVGHAEHKTNCKSDEKFIDDAIDKHGSKYDYAKVSYVNCNTKVIITCSKHGDFEQTPRRHLEGRGCSKCAREFSNECKLLFNTD